MALHARPGWEVCEQWFFLWGSYWYQGSSKSLRSSHWKGEKKQKHFTKSIQSCTYNTKKMLSNIQLIIFVCCLVLDKIFQATHETGLSWLSLVNNAHSESFEQWRNNASVLARILDLSLLLRCHSSNREVWIRQRVVHINWTETLLKRWTYLSDIVLGTSSKAPSSLKWRPALEGLAKVEINRPRDWKAAWRTCKSNTKKKSLVSPQRNIL